MEIKTVVIGIIGLIAAGWVYFRYIAPAAKTTELQTVNDAQDLVDQLIADQTAAATAAAEAEAAATLAQYQAQYAAALAAQQAAVTAAAAAAADRAAKAEFQAHQTLLQTLQMSLGFGTEDSPSRYSFYIWNWNPIRGNIPEGEITRAEYIEMYVRAYPWLRTEYGY